MARGRTLWEMFLDWINGPADKNYFNPLKAQIGRSVTIDDIDWRDRDFMLKEIHQYKRFLQGREFVFADYVLTERTTKGEETTIRLRLNPAEDAQHTGRDHYALMLFLEDDLAYNEGLHDVLRDPTGLFRIEHDGNVTAEFTRLHGLREPYKAAVTILTDPNQDGRISKDEIDVKRIEYWDYEREVADAAGQPEKEYLFAELDQHDGWTQIWRGKEFDARKITVV